MGQRAYIIADYNSNPYYAGSLAYAAAHLLKKQGYSVINPPVLERIHTSIKACRDSRMEMLAQADAVCFVGLYVKDPVCKEEADAALAMGIKHYYYHGENVI